MLDECKGERLEEVLAVFSNAVLKKVLQSKGSKYEALAQQLALENFSYSGERTILSALILAHKASLSKHLRSKVDARARYQDFSDLLNLNDRRIARRHEQLKQAIEENRTNDSLPLKEVYDLQDTARRNWSGNPEWLESILYGDSRSNADGFLGTRFDMISKHVDNGTIGDLEGTNRDGLLEQLNARVKDQEKRLARWQDFGKTLSKPAGSSPENETAKALNKLNKINLGFTRHQNLQIDGSNTKKIIQSNSVSLEEYTRLIENMRKELADVGKPQPRTNRPPRQSLLAEKRRSLLVSSPVPSEDVPETKDEEWSSASDLEEKSLDSINYATKSVSRTPPSETSVLAPEPKELRRQLQPVRPPVPTFIETARSMATSRSVRAPEEPPRDPSPPKVRPITPPAMESPRRSKPIDSENDLADQILNSISASSPSPKKPRHTLSLAERTRLSMSRTSHSQYSDLHDEFEIADLPRLSIKPRPSLAPRAQSSESDPHADLIERTRKSMAGFEAAQKKAQIERRRSMKDAKKKQRESSFFPKVEEEVLTPDMSTVELLEGDPDYESVFKSRPKIATSPAVSPTRIWEDDE